MYQGKDTGTGQDQISSSFFYFLNRFVSLFEHFEIIYFNTKSTEEFKTRNQNLF